MAAIKPTAPYNPRLTERSRYTTVLFPMAEQKIPATDLERMACQCAELHNQGVE